MKAFALVTLSAIVCSGCATTPVPPAVSVLETWKIGSTGVYAGKFVDVAGHQGPLECKLTRIGTSRWHAAFSAANEGTGPNSPFVRDAELTSSRHDRRDILSGEVPMKAGGPYIMQAVLTADRLTARYERKAGGWPGAFDLARLTESDSLHDEVTRAESDQTAPRIQSEGSRSE